MNEVISSPPVVCQEIDDPCSGQTTLLIHDGIRSEIAVRLPLWFSTADVRRITETCRRAYRKAVETREKIDRSEIDNHEMLD
jgi:hypothetical protein